ncbi:hypothetical protein FQZ97_883600 [compost metagenome]
MHAGVAPVAVEVVAGEGGAGAAQFEQAIGRLDGDFRGQHLGLRHGHRGARYVLRVRRRTGGVQSFAGALQQRIGGLDADTEVADLDDGQRIFAGLVHAGVDPRAGLLADEVDGVAQGSAGDAGIDGGGGELGERAGEGRAFVGAVGGEQVECRYPQVARQHRAAGGGALTDAGPVVDDDQARRAARDEDQLRLVVLVDSQHRQPVRVQRSGAITLAAVDHMLATVAADRRADVLHVAPAGFRQRVGEAIALQRQVEEETLLLFAALQADVLQQAVVVLRNLPEGRVGGRDDGDHFGQRGVAHFSAAKHLGHGDAPEATVGKYVHHF